MPFFPWRCNSGRKVERLPSRTSFLDLSGVFAGKTARVRKFCGPCGLFDPEREKAVVWQRRVSMDATDRKVLNELYSDSDRSRKVIARAVNLSEPSLSKKITNLQADGIIENFTVKI